MSPSALRSPSEVERIHATILRALKAESKRGPAVKIATVAKLVGKDPRTVRSHLRLLAMHHVGLFLDADQCVFALRESLHRRLSEDSQDSLVEDLASANRALAAKVWSNEPDS